MNNPDVFELAVEAVISGDTVALASLLREHPDLVKARSARPSRPTLLHYVAANGVEEERQKSPRNSVEIARLLLAAGAGPDALAEMYGGQQTTMNMLVSSCHPAEAGVQVPLVHTLVDFGASVERDFPLQTALAHGYPAAAAALVQRGAPVKDLAAAAGLGDMEKFEELLPGADAGSRHRALALAAQHGHVEIVRALLDAGEDPGRFIPKECHGHSTPLHQAALRNHLGVVKLLVERGAPLDVRDTVHNGTPLGWAIHGRRMEVAEYLRAQESSGGTAPASEK